MLVVDLHALHAVHVLNLVDDVLLNSRRTHDIENVGRGDSAVGQRCAGTHEVVFLNKNLLRQRHEIFLGLSELGHHSDFAVTTLNLAEFDLTVNFRHDGGIRRVAGLEQLGNTGQTTGDVTGTACGAGNLGESFAGLDFLALLVDKVSTHRKRICGENLAVVAVDFDRRHVLAVAAFDDHAVFSLMSAITVDTEGDVLDKVHIVYLTRNFGHDNGVEGVPFANHVAAVDFGSVIEEELRTVRYVGRHKRHAGLVVNNTHFGKTAYNYLRAVFGIYSAEFVDFKLTVVLGG